MPLPDQPAWSHVRSAFQRIWGYPDFRPPQGEIIRGLLSRQDALIVMPTGGGKSICFQLPALLQTGLTLVVSPLVALMENQVQELKQRRLPAELLHAELSPHQRRQTLQALEQQQLRLLYLSPETLFSPPVWQRLCQPHLQINGLILDEAHCLVQWGDTFRPAYRRLGAVRPALLHARGAAALPFAIAAFTATADPAAQRTIADTLQLRQPQTFLLSPYRPNLHLRVKTVWTPSGRRQMLLKFLRAHPQQSGLVYVRTRRAAEELAAWLSTQGKQTAAYHAGLSPSARRAIEASWLNDAFPFVVCTSAFGMGINKPNVRWIAHFHAPALLSEYVQEIGRAGRDGNLAEALAVVSEPTGWLDPEDQQRQQFFSRRIRLQQQAAQRLIAQLPQQGSVNEISRQFPDGAIALALLHSSGQLQWQDPFHYVLLPTERSPARLQSTTDSIARYLRTRECRWRFLLHSFGFTQEAQHLRCGHCDRCQAQR